MNKIKKYFIKQIFNPLFWEHYKGLNRYKIFCDIKKNQWNSLAENQDEQKRKLFKMIKYADSNIPYYSNIIKNKNIQYSQDTIFEDVKKFPILTKKIIRNSFDKIHSTKNIKNYFKNTSGGTTGEPVVFLQTSDFSDHSFASVLLTDSFGKCEIGDPKIKLWGSERDIEKNGKGIKRKIIEFTSNETTLNSFRMNDDMMAKYISIINKKRPKVIRAYVQSIDLLSQFILCHNLCVHSPGVIITSAGTLHNSMKKRIEKAFGTKVINFYGSRELGTIAFSCPENTDEMHLNIFDQYIEVLNEDLNPTEPGEIGDLYITSLNNFVMPLIRYKIGDVAIVKKNEKCHCNRGLPLIKSVKGREVNLFKTINGDRIDGEYFTHLFYFKSWVKKFQIIQKSIDMFLIKVVLSDEVVNLEKNEIEQKIKKIMDHSIKIHWEFVDDIPPLKNGKFLYTICEI